MLWALWRRLIFFLSRTRREGPHTPPLLLLLQWIWRESLLARRCLSTGLIIRAAISSLPAQIIGELEMGKIFREFTIQVLGAHSTRSLPLSEAGSEVAGAPKAGKQSFSIPTRNEGEEGSWTKINNFWLLWIKACYNQNSPPSAANALGPRSSKIIRVLEATGQVSSAEKTLLVSGSAGECFYACISVPGSPGACVDSLSSVQPGVR